MSMTRPASLLARLRSGARVGGMQSFSASPVLVEAMGHAGLDFVVVDMEHCPTGLETLAHLLRAADAAGIVSLTRVPDLDPLRISRALDLGVAGVVVPHASPERCRAALDAARYAPEGTRGACPVVRSTGWLAGDWREHARQANADVLVIPLLEDASAIDSLEAMFDIDGIDIVFIGPFDLSISLGLDGADFRHPVMADILDRCLALAQARGKFVMTTVGATLDGAYAGELLGRGVRMLRFSADVAVFLNACRAAVRLRDAAG
jgi:2-keto-3-deoxy-L-rhamnonate aldolase RhmA